MKFLVHTSTQTQLLFSFPHQMGTNICCCASQNLRGHPESSLSCIPRINPSPTDPTTKITNPSTSLYPLFWSILTMKLRRWSFRACLLHKHLPRPCACVFIILYSSSTSPPKKNCINVRTHRKWILPALAVLVNLPYLSPWINSCPFTIQPAKHSFQNHQPNRVHLFLKLP